MTEVVVTTLPKVGDIVIYTGHQRAGSADIWDQRRNERWEYLVIETAYEQRGDTTMNSARCFRLGDPDSQCWASDEIIVSPESLRIIRRATYEEVT